MNNVTATTPHDQEAEQSVIGSVLCDNSTIEDILETLKPESFFFESHQHIFQAMVDLKNTDQPIDEIIIGDKLKKRGKLNESGGYAYISSLVDYSPNPQHIKNYCKIVHGHYLSRNLIKVGNDIAKNGRDPKHSINELLTESGKKLSEINDSLNTEPNLYDIKTIMKGVIVDCEKIIAGGGDVVGFKTGFKDFDNKTLGLQRQELAILGARPSMGKSSMFLNIAYNIARRYRDETVLVFSLEMSKKQLVQRLQASIAKVNLTKIREVKELTQDEWDKIMMATNEISDLPILINDDSLISIEKICSIAKQYAKKNKISTIIIDYLGKLKYDGTYQNEEIKISNITSMSKDLAKKLDCNVLLLSQLNRSLESRGDKRPIMSDLKGSGAIEADADLAMFIYRDSVYNENSKEKGIAEILIRKNRSGETGVVKLQWTGKYTKFSNLSSEYQYS